MNFLELLNIIFILNNTFKKCIYYDIKEILSNKVTLKFLQ